MNKQTIRAFSAGILFSVIVTLIFIILFQENVKLTEIVKEDFIIIQKDELKQKEEKINSLEKEITRQSNAKNNAVKKKTKQQEAKATLEITLEVEPGMKSQDISEKLTNTNIIKNKNEFENFLMQEGYADKIQVGQYVINSTMNFKEIADIITEK
ncbi:hypothetical protein [Bacillus seohaeanensis]|jgi:hypothetical protein|uniref:YceG-like family protein n=1 Tax=Bacillus seohaeanensis TaxID=284580 RepID=A0ABW5RQU2_9BACI